MKVVEVIDTEHSRKEVSHPVINRNEESINYDMTRKGIKECGITLGMS